MLLLLFRNMMWAAWWPYCTMLLAMEKAAQERERAAPAAKAQAAESQRPATPSPQPAQAHAQERVMGNEAPIKTEIPEPLREMMKLGIAQAERAFETFAAIGEKSWKSLENSSPMARGGLLALNAKIFEIARRNAAANFALVMRLAEAKDPRQALELQSRHMQEQLDGFVRQLEEMRDLAAQVIQKVSPAASADAGATRSTPAAQDNLRSGGFASYAPSSSVTPGSGPGRGS